MHEGHSIASIRKYVPFKVGEYIEGAGVGGIVEEIHVFSTLLGTLDNKAIIVPNANMKKRFDAEGIQAPVPRRDVHLHQA